MDLQPLKSPLNHFLANIFAKLLIPKFSLLLSIICASSSHQIQIFPFNTNIDRYKLKGQKGSGKKRTPLNFRTFSPLNFNNYGSESNWGLTNYLKTTSGRLPPMPSVSLLQSACYDNRKIHLLIMKLIDRQIWLIVKISEQIPVIFEWLLKNRNTSTGNGRIFD